MNTTRMILKPARKAGTMPSAAPDKAAPAADPAADIFAQALIDDSIHELDWLWVASQLTDVVQRRYCLERALAINSNSELARRELRELATRPRR